MRAKVKLWYMALTLVVFIAGCSSGGGGGDTTSLSNAKAITAFSFTSPAATGTIDETAKTIAVTAPHGTDVTALIATFTTTGMSVNVGGTAQVSGTTPNNFTNPVIYTVTAADGTTAIYTVTVTTATRSAKDITAFSFTSPAAMGIIDVNAKAIAVMTPHGTNVTSLIATFTTNGANVKVGSTVQVSGTTPNDFTSPVVYTVTAADSTAATYTVTVKVAAIALPKTGQTICSNSAGTVIACANTGQDGELQKGVAWPNPRFTANADTSVTDNLTGLVWAPDGNLMPTRDPGWDTDIKFWNNVDQTVNDGRVTWEHALDYVAKLNSESYLGHSDWRLPNRKELRSLINYGQSSTETWLNTQGFTNVQPYGFDSFYWSSTSDSLNAGLAWGWTMWDFKGSNHYLWPVRTGQGTGAPAELPKTGQTTCYSSYLAEGTIISCATTTAAGQDGALQMGVAWPSPRFVANSDTTITDNLTGLIWAPDGNVMPTRDRLWDLDGTVNDGIVTWQHSLDYVAKLNAESYLGHNDWRLPNVNELESLINDGQSDTATWLNTQGFTNVQNYTYLSSTNGSSVNMADGSVGCCGFFVWPVRAGQ